MVVQKLHEAGLRSEHAYCAAVASIGISFLSWAVSVKGEKAGMDRADRWGIFVGQWAPTFFALGCAMRMEEQWGRPRPQEAMEREREREREAAPMGGSPLGG